MEVIGIIVFVILVILTMAGMIFDGDSVKGAPNSKPRSKPRRKQSDSCNMVFGGGNISVNGVSYSGGNLRINGDDVYIDGVLQDSIEQKNITIQCKDVTGGVHLTSGKIYCDAVSGDVKSISGDIYFTEAMGSVGTTSGDIKAETIRGNVKTTSGDVESYTIGGSCVTNSGDITGLT